MTAALAPRHLADAAERPPRAQRLAVGGWVRSALRLAPDDLADMPWVLVSDFDVVCTLDGSHGVLAPVRAVRLGDLIERARPAFEQRTDFKRVALVAEGAEGYRALFSWAEIFNSPLGAGVLVAFDQPHHRLPAHAGPFALLPRHDLATGPRYVRRLRTLELHKLW